MLAKRYEVALLTVDAIVLEAVSNGNTPAGLRGRELCAEAAHRRAEEMRALEGEDGATAPAPGTVKMAGGLSVEAVTAHTQGTGTSQGQLKSSVILLSHTDLMALYPKLLKHFCLLLDVCITH